VKKLHGVAENHRVAIRNIRRDGNEVVKKLLKDKKIIEDEEKRGHDEIQKLTDSYMQKVDQASKTKEKDILEIRGLPYSHLGRTKRQLADQKEFGLGEEGLSWIANQMLEAFMSSRHIDEVFAEDVILRRKIKDICKKHMQVDEAIDQEVRDLISPGRITVRQWVDVITAAHRLKIPTTSTIMYGHLETPAHWVKHMNLLRDIQDETDNVTRFLVLGHHDSQEPTGDDTTLAELDCPHSG